jgi:hypothetical protein
MGLVLDLTDQLALRAERAGVRDGVGTTPIGARHARATARLNDLAVAAGIDSGCASDVVVARLIRVFLADPAVVTLAASGN